MGRMVALCLSAALSLAGCNKDSDKSDAGVPKDAKVEGCWRPATITSCILPPNSCTDKVLCLNCTCTGARRVFACNGLTQDCRYFCTGCYPMNYTLCTPDAPKSILGLCGYCYFDAGRGKCDKLKKDAGKKG